jgi:sec-independent protein translocase protein TatC
MALPLFNRAGKEDNEMSFMDHLEALRWHVVRSAAVVLVLAVVIFIFIDPIFDHIILGPLQNDFISKVWLCKLSHWLNIGESLCMPNYENLKLQTTQFSSQFMVSINVAIMGAIVVGFPYLFWEIWRFIKPALSEKELRSSRGAIIFVSFFFFLGVAFGYFLLAPFTFNFLFNYRIGTTNMITAIPTLDDYNDNLINVMLGAGISFQLPVAAYVLTRIGLLNGSFLKKYRKYAYVAILLVAAIITPSPDWTSQLIVFLPLMLLYEFSIVICKRVEKQDKKKAAEWS